MLHNFLPEYFSLRLSAVCLALFVQIPRKNNSGARFPSFLMLFLYKIVISVLKKIKKKHLQERNAVVCGSQLGQVIVQQSTMCRLETTGQKRPKQACERERRKCVSSGKGESKGEGSEARGGVGDGSCCLSNFRFGAFCYVYRCYIHHCCLHDANGPFGECAAT